MVEEEFELGADAVTAGDDDGLGVFAEVVAGGEEAEGAEEFALGLGAFYVSFDITDE